MKSVSFRKNHFSWRNFQRSERSNRRRECNGEIPVLNRLGLVLMFILCGCNSGSKQEPLFDAPDGLGVGEAISSASIDLVPDLKQALETESPLVVVCVLSTECDATKGILTRLKTLARKKKDKVSFVGFATSDADHLSEFLAANELGFEVVGDFDHEIAQLLGATRTPSFFVFDAERVLCFKGPLDDSTFIPREVSEQWLESAIDATLGGKEIRETKDFVGKPILGGF